MDWYYLSIEKKVFKSITSVCFRLRVGLAVGLLVAGADKPMPFWCYRYLLLTILFHFLTTNLQHHCHQTYPHISILKKKKDIYIDRAENN
ncbi:hypothetical protein BpHYR1_041267 [Brachionus plicatilis]|uniref:Uncharacterized protein n=1 Tax=Brachionus plicatilis TaxID=10195 RepID=A0A3M7QT52_BRAPC|nr:hypothetical protein BpHYR1_041267 [Brachionus plicatilis]